MAEPIYKMWQGRFTEAWYQLSEQEQQRLLKLVTDGREAAGGKEVLTCIADWSNEQWPVFGVEEFPDIEAVQRFQQSLRDIHWARYIESRTTLGTSYMPR